MSDRDKLCVPNAGTGLGGFCLVSCDSAFVFCKASPAAWGSALLVVAVLKWGACTPLETDKEIAERDLKLHNGGWWEGARGELIR